MKNRNKTILASIIALNFAGAAAFAETDRFSVSALEQKVKKRLERNGQTDALYRRYVMDLARAYHREGRREEGEKNFRYLVKLCDAMNCPAFACDTMVEWADVITYDVNGRAPSAQDISEARKLTLDAIARGRSHSAAERRRVLEKTAGIYRKLNRSDWLAALDNDHDQVISTLESTRSLSVSEIERLAKDLDRQADRLAIFAREKMSYDKPGEFSNTNASDATSKPWRPRLFTHMTAESTRYFLQAEQLKLRAMEQFNRLEPTNSERIKAQFALVSFYEEFHEPVKAGLEKSKLANLMKTKSESGLLPKWTCTGCGRG